MVFINKLSSLMQESKHDTIVTENGVRLLFPNHGTPTPPLAKHYIYPSMPRTVQQSLLQSYCGSFPDELIEIYNTANGMDLFWERINFEDTDIVIAQQKISVFGVPQNNDRRQIEPLNIVLEDIDRIGQYPEAWLKFGSASDISGNQVSSEYDLFVDTKHGSVYMIEKISNVEVGKWQNIDKCLCELFDKS